MKSYNLYNFIRVDVDDSYTWTDTLFFAQGIAAENTDIECIGRIFVKRVKKFDKSLLRFIGDGSYIGENTYFDENYGVCLQKITDNEIHLTVEQECNEWLVIAVELLLLQQNKTLLHAAAVEKDGKALVMPSWGGVGKTAIVCKFVKDYGWRLLGDDLVIIDNEKVYSFLKPFVIYPYHKNLFPEVFSSGNNRIVKNLHISKMMSKLIPTVKRILRPVPFLLAFLRKHNPQSMRVSPFKIFDSDSLGHTALPQKVVWLDRTTKKDIEYKNITISELASRATTITSVELFSEKLCSIFHLCGCGVYSYDETISRINKIVCEFSKSADVQILQIPTIVPIEEVGNIAFENLI